jgi:CO/xanthine dehydrogenase Mo-binding subunit
MTSFEKAGGLADILVLILEFNGVAVNSQGCVSMVGFAAATANSIQHGAGRRLRDLPIRIDYPL